MRSRVTLASTEAAATQAATRSPFHTARPGRASPGTGKPSVSTYSGAGSSVITARRSASRLVACIPRASSSSTGMDTTDQETARSTTSAYTRSRAAGVSSLESARPGTRPRRPAGSTQAAATSGPAQAPRPASSAPATEANPRRRSERSRSQRRSPSGGVARRERGAIAVRIYDLGTTPPSGTPPQTERTGPVLPEEGRPGARVLSGAGSQLRGGHRVGAAGAGAAAGVAARQHERDRVGPVASTQLAQDGLDVGLDG